jgi:toxin ParE1/3/4
MSVQLQITPAAQADIAEHTETIRQASPRSALRFVDAISETLDLLLRFPHLGTPFDDRDATFAGIRFSVPSRFRNYVIYYRPTVDGIEVLRVLYGAQDATARLRDNLEG